MTLLLVRGIMAAVLLIVPRPLLMDEIHRNPTPPLQDFGPSTATLRILTVVAPMLTRESEGSKKTVREVVQDFVHQQYEVLL